MGKSEAVAPYSGAMLAIVARSGRDRLLSPAPQNSTNLPTTPNLRSISVTASTRSVAVDPSGSDPDQAHAYDLRVEQVERLAQEHGLGFDAADTPAEHAQTVDHGGVGVGADEGVGKGDGLRAYLARHDHLAPGTRD